MPTTTGTVRCMRVGDDFGFVSVNKTAGGIETLILWFNPSPTTSLTRILQSMWVSMLREAKAGNIPISVQHDSGAIVSNVQLGEG